MKKSIVLIVMFVLSLQVFVQTSIVTYAGGSGNETLYDVTQVSDSSFLVVGYADNLAWVGNAPQTQLIYSIAIPNALGTNW